MHIKELDWHFDYQELLHYYNIVSNKYQHLKWDDRLLQDVYGADRHQINGVYGWGIQSNLVDSTKPCPPYNIHKETVDDYYDTELVFGFINNIKIKYPEARQISISGHPSGVCIDQHVDTDKYLKIHLPIIASEQSFFVFDNIEYNLQPGKAYLVNTNLPHGTINKGNIDRVHLFFKVPKEKYNAFV